MTKRRGHGEGSLYRRPDGGWRAQIDLGWRNGKRVRASVAGATRREVIEKLRAAQRSVDAGIQPTSDRLTVAAYLEDWLAATRSIVRPSRMATVTEPKTPSDFDHEAHMAEAEEEVAREGMPTAQRGREDDYWEPGQNILDGPDDTDE